MNKRKTGNFGIQNNQVEVDAFISPTYSENSTYFCCKFMQRLSLMKASMAVMNKQR